MQKNICHKPCTATDCHQINSVRTVVYWYLLCFCYLPCTDVPEKKEGKTIRNLASACVVINRGNVGSLKWETTPSSTLCNISHFLCGT